MEIYKLTASRLASLLQILGALVADYIQNPKKPMDKALVPMVRNQLQWGELSGLDEAIKSAIRGTNKLESLYNLGQELKVVLPAFRSNTEFSTPEIQMLRALRSYLSTDSETALAYIRKNAAVFKSPMLSKMFAPPVPKSDHEGLRRVVKNLVGRDGKHLTVDESQLVKETSPDQYAEYQKLRKDHNNEFKAQLANLVRDSGKSMIPYQTAYKFAMENGFTHSLVPGFTGMIDDQGRWFTKDGELITGVPNLATYTNVVMNDGTDPEAQWVFKAVKPDGNYAYAYTANFRRAQSQSKYENVAQLMNSIDKIRKKWLVHIKNFDISSKTSVAAVVLEILYNFAARIGSEPGRGVGTLLVKNLSEVNHGINLLYLGKDSIRTRHVIKATDPIHKLLISALLQLKGEKGPNMPLFTAEINGKFVRVTPGDVNRLFRELGAPAGVTVHKIRTCRGTTLFKELVDDDAKRRPPKTEKEAIERYKVMTEQVGKLLNHKRGVGSDNEKVTGTTAATSYIDSSLQIELFQRWGFRPPSALEKMLRAGDD